MPTLEEVTEQNSVLLQHLEESKGEVMALALEKETLQTTIDQMIEERGSLIAQIASIESELKAAKQSLLNLEVSHGKLVQSRTSKTKP